MPKNSERQNQSAEVLTKRELAEQVATATGLNPKQSKAAVEAVLAAIRAGLVAEKRIAVPPLGKIIAKRSQPGTDKEKMVYRIALADGDQAE